MATNWYVSALAGGGGDGSIGSPWTLDEAITNINNSTVGNSDTVWVKADGTYTTTGITISVSGGVGAWKKLRGYSSLIGDSGKATIQKTTGDNNLVTCSQNYWRVSQLILDNNNKAGACFYDWGATTLVRALECKNSTYAGIVIFGGKAFDCYVHNTGTIGIYAGNAYFCLVTDNISGFGISASSGEALYCITKNNGYNLYCNTVINCISDSPHIQGVTVEDGWMVLNTIIVNTPISCDGLHLNYALSGGLGSFINNIDFYNNVSNSNIDISNIENAYVLDPQFNNPSVYDYTRIGSNLDDKGFSIIYGINYKIDIGIDQKSSVDYPIEADVRDGVSYDNGNKTGQLDLPSISRVVYGITFDSGTKTGAFVVPIEGNVTQGISYGYVGEYLGTAEGLPAPTGFVPRFKLYDSNNTSLLYTFPLVQYTNAPQFKKKITSVSNIRGIGEVEIEGAEEAWDILIRFILMPHATTTNNYENIAAAIDTLESTVALNTKYYLRIDKTPTTYYLYKVKRIKELEYPESLRTDMQEVNCTLRANAW